jgi:hypothetical protein
MSVLGPDPDPASFQTMSALPLRTDIAHGEGEVRKLLCPTHVPQ